MTSKPQIVLIPGAWHTSICYIVVVVLIEEAGYSTTALTPPSVGAKALLTSTNTDVAFTHAGVSKLADVDRDVLVLMHSYVGVPGSDTMRGLSKDESQIHCGLPAEPDQ